VSIEAAQHPLSDNDARAVRYAALRFSSEIAGRA
jgi:hypothetical protein